MKIFSTKFGAEKVILIFGVRWLLHLGVLSVQCASQNSMDWFVNGFSTGIPFWEERLRVVLYGTSYCAWLKTGIHLSAIPRRVTLSRLSVLLRMAFQAARPDTRAVGPSKWASTEPRLICAQCGTHIHSRLYIFALISWAGSARLSLARAQMHSQLKTLVWLHGPSNLPGRSGSN